MHVEVNEATASEAPILDNLLELYAHDFSEIFELQLGADGRFGYTELPLYWQESNRRPLLLKVDGNLAGFALLRKCSLLDGDANVWDVSEFFIVRGYRRHRIGTRVAHEIWKRFRGRWEVRVMERNTAARAFWHQAIADFMGRNVAASFDPEHRWHVFSFDTESTAGALNETTEQAVEKEGHD